MKLLLDTHAFLWWLAGSRQLSANARSAISDRANDVVVSVATAWEIATKHRLGKLPQAERVAQDVLVSVHRQWHQANIRHYRLTLRLAYVVDAGCLSCQHRLRDRPQTSQLFTRG